uniref:Uncharacterized protein n=1 Tax=Bionectria ochroleuca TaxID=29856 RepID=A0A8H7KCG9_BIOOC
MPRRRAAKAFTGADFSTDDEDTAIPALEKPNLPKLRGTPSSRRQYTYGSDAEPQASPRYRHDGPVDLSNAVKGVLNRQHEDDQRSARARMPPPLHQNLLWMTGTRLTSWQRIMFGQQRIQRNKTNNAVRHLKAPALICTQKTQLLRSAKASRVL